MHLGESLHATNIIKIVLFHKPPGSGDERKGYLDDVDDVETHGLQHQSLKAQTGFYARE